jgi:hypothetical protein
VVFFSFFFSSFLFASDAREEWTQEGTGGGHGPHQKIYIWSFFQKKKKKEKAKRKLQMNPYKPKITKINIYIYIYVNLVHHIPKKTVKKRF